MSVPENARLRAVATFSSGPNSKAQNVYHLKHTSTGAKTDEQVMVALGEYIEAMMDELTVRCSDEYILDKVEGYISVWPLWEPLGVVNPVWAGTNANERMPSGVACMVRAYKNRSGYPDKKFLGGFTEENSSGDVWNAAVITAAGLYAAVWIGQFTGTDSVILQPIAWTPSTGADRTYTSYNVAVTTSYQRRRKPGVGLT